MTGAPDAQHALAEYQELGQYIRQYVEIITSTERFAVAGAAAVASFSVSGLTEQLDRAQMMLSAIPFVLLALAGLRCLTLYLVIRSAVTHLETLEATLFADPDLGFNRVSNVKGSVRRSVELTSGAYWAFACAAALSFWLFANGFV